MLCCPMTSAVKGYPFEVAMPVGAVVEGVILSDQIKSLDWRAHKAKFAGHAPDDVISEVIAKAQTLLE